MTIGNKIKQYRKDKKLTQQQLADLTNRSKSTIEKYESNKVTPSFKVLEEIAKALDVNYNDFFDKPRKTGHKWDRFNDLIDIPKMKIELAELEALDNICNVYGYDLTGEDYEELKQLIEMFINSKRYKEMNK